MSQTQAKELLNDLLQQPPAQVKDWLQSVWLGHQQLPEQFNWLGLAEVAAADARSQENLVWAQVAIMIYEWLAKDSKVSSKDGYINSAMTLRSYMIGKKEVVLGDTVLDVEQIVRWFFENLPFSYEDAERKALIWKTLDMQDIKALRGIKNRLRIIAGLVNKDRLYPSQELKSWLSLQNKLP